MHFTQSSGALYGILLALGGKVLAAERSQRQAKPLPPLDSGDVLVLDNFVTNTASIRWV